MKTSAMTARPRARILVVDDVPTNIEVLFKVLGDEHDLSFALSGQQALALVGRGALPDLILLDVMMPEMDGYEICAALQHTAATRDIPIIFITAKTDTESETRALAAGAVDFIHKPFSRDVVRARVRLHLERREAERELAQARAREADIAAAIQKRLLLRQVPADLDGFSIASRTTASQVVDGDFYTFTRFSSTCFEVLIADVMGKGVAAALLAAGVKSTYRRVLLELLAGDAERGIPSPEAVVNAMHAVLTPELIALESFVTLTLARLDRAAGTMRWVNAGHTPLLLARSRDVAPIELPGNNLPLGVVEAEAYVSAATSIAPGDGVMLYSDGFTDATNDRGVEYGLDRLRDVLARERARQASSEAILAALEQDVEAFTGNRPAGDDRSAVMIQLEP